MANIIQIRRGLSSTWNTLNPILADGEIAWARDTSEFKIGNGVDSWSALTGIPIGELGISDIDGLS